MKVHLKSGKIFEITSNEYSELSRAIAKNKIFYINDNASLFLRISEIEAITEK